MKKSFLILVATGFIHIALTYGIELELVYHIAYMISHGFEAGPSSSPLFLFYKILVSPALWFFPSFDSYMKWCSATGSSWLRLSVRLYCALSYGIVISFIRYAFLLLRRGSPDSLVSESKGAKAKRSSGRSFLGLIVLLFIVHAGITVVSFSFHVSSRFKSIAYQLENNEGTSPVSRSLVEEDESYTRLTDILMYPLEVFLPNERILEFNIFSILVNSLCFSVIIAFMIRMTVSQKQADKKNNKASTHE